MTDETPQASSGRPPEPPKDELIGRMMGQFQIVEEIGRGGMATVYRALQQSMNRTVAVKVLPRQMLHDPGFYDRFVREVEVISALEHPHILPIYDYGQTDGLPFIAMRYLGGGSLEQRIRRGALSLEEIEKPLRQVAQALDYAHQQGIIHRDLKPGNIMLDEGGNAYLSDFGIARVLGSDLTGSMIIGTPAYMSPEQANGLPIDSRSDIYSLGIVLFELLTGRGPFQAETPMAVLLKHITEPIPPLRNFRDDIPPSVEAVVEKATAKDPDHRYIAAGEMAEAYSRALREGDINPAVSTWPGAASATPPPMPAAAPSTTNHATTSPGAPAASATDTGMQPARSGRGPLLFVLGLLIFTIIGVGIFIAVEVGQEEDPEDEPGFVTLPTPFPRASTITGDMYTISMPDEWIPPQIYIDQSEGERLRHVWIAEDNTAMVALNLFEQQRGVQFDLETAAERYVETVMPRQVASNFFIDSSTAENGTMRLSFRVPDMETLGEMAARFGGQMVTPGQMDIFVQQHGDQVAVVEMYTADITQNTLVPRLQLILDSLRINTGM
ncbi:MAG: serine/threonine-protein kinase [Chloroflexota bacterium]